MAVSVDGRTERLRIVGGYHPGQPLPDFAYTADEDALWARVFASLRVMHEQYACQQYRAAARWVELPVDRVPQLHEVSGMLHATTGFRLAPAVGALSGRLFYGPLADGVLSSTPDVRPVRCEAFSPEPDVIHELVGHAVMLADPEFADLYRGFGRAALCATTDETLAVIARLFWFTMEVGLVDEDGRPRGYGAAILSSVAEMESFGQADLRKFRMAEMLDSDIDDQSCQRLYFVADSMSQMMGEVQEFLEEVINA